MVIARSDRSDTAVDRLPLTTVDAAVAIRGQGRAKGHMTVTTAVAMTDTVSYICVTLSYAGNELKNKIVKNK